MSSEGYHEPVELISERTKNLHRGIVSLIEELEAIDWYQQRAEACSDEELRAVILHHRNEEVEHALMNLEWLRRNEPIFDKNARIYLFSEGPITEVEARAEASHDGAASGPKPRPPAEASHDGLSSPEPRPRPRMINGSLSVGSLRRG